MAREEFPGNSRLRRERDPDQKRLTPVTKARNARRPPKGIIQTLLGDGAYEVVQYVFGEIIIPALKDIASDAFSNSVDMALFGESRSRSRRRKEHTSYGSFYKDRDEKKRISYGRSRYRLDEIVIGKRSEAEDALNELQEIIEQYDSASVADFYELVGLTADYTKHGVGWTNLSRVQIIRVPDGYVIDLPEPRALD